MNLKRECFQNLANPDNFMALPRYINLPTLMK